MSWFPVAVHVVDDRVDHDVAAVDRAGPHVAPTGQERLRPRDAAPRVDAGESQLFARVELPAHDRVDTVAGDRDVGLDRCADRARHPGPEVERHPLIGLVEPDALMVGEEARGAEPGHRGVPQGEMQPATMEAHLRERIAREPAARLGVDELTEAVEEAALTVLDALSRQHVAEAERRHLAHGVRQESDADAQLLHLGRALVHTARKAALVEGKREGESPDSAPDDGNVHDPAPQQAPAGSAPRSSEGYPCPASVLSDRSAAMVTPAARFVWAHDAQRGPAPARDRALDEPLLRPRDRGDRAGRARLYLLRAGLRDTLDPQLWGRVALTRFWRAT